MNIKKFLEYYSIGYEDSDYLQYKDVKIDNITLLTKAMELLKIKYNNLYTDNPNTETFENKKSLLIKINIPNRFINVIYLRCNDDYIYIDNYVQGNSFYYKCDQLLGFKSFLKKNSDKINNIIKESSKRSFNRVEKGSSLVSSIEPKKKGFFDFLKRKNK